MDTKRKTYAQNDYSQGRLSPSFIEGEIEVLNGILNTPQVFQEISSYFIPDVFYNEDHRNIARAMKDLWLNGQSIDFTSVFYIIKKRGETGQAEATVNYNCLADLRIKDVGIPLKIDQYHTLVQLWMLREQIKLGSILIEKGYSQEDPFEIKDFAISFLERIDLSDKIEREDFKAILNMMFEKKDKSEVPYLQTGIPELDEFLQWENKRIFIFAAAKKHGKSKFNIWLLLQLLKHNKISLYMNLFEDDPQDVIITMLSSLSGIEFKKIKFNKLSQEEKNKLAMANAFLQKQDIEINTDPHFDKMTNGFITFAKDKINPICLIDNYGSVVFNARDSNEVDEKVMQKLVQVRKKTQGIIILIHHLTKEVANPENRMYGYRPTDRQIRGSGRITDYANTVYTINKPGQYKDLVTEERHLNPKRLLPSGEHIIERMFIIESTANRHDTNKIIRFIADLSTTQFEHFKKP